MICELNGAEWWEEMASSLCHWRRWRGPREATGGRVTHKSCQYEWACWQRKHSELSLALDGFLGGGILSAPLARSQWFHFFWLFIVSSENSLSPPKTHSIVSTVIHPLPFGLPAESKGQNKSNTLDPWTELVCGKYPWGRWKGNKTPRTLFTPPASCPLVRLVGAVKWFADAQLNPLLGWGPLPWWPEETWLSQGVKLDSRMTEGSLSVSHQGS